MKQYYAYEEFKVDVNILLPQVNAFGADVIVGIARGGLTLAHAMAEGLNIRHLETLQTQLYDDTLKRDTISLFGNVSFFDKKVLVVDDIADSGETLTKVMQYLQKNSSQSHFKSMTLFYKETSSYEPDFWLHKAENWIEFFWEKDFFITEKI